MSFFRRLRRLGEKNAPQGKSNIPKRIVARIVRTHDGYTIINEHFISKGKQVTLLFTKKMNKIGRTKRKRQRQDWPLTKTEDITNSTIRFPSLKATMKGAGEAQFTHCRWKAKLYNCAIHEEENPTKEKGQNK